MRALILTVSAGEGHNAMSKALELCLSQHCETKIFDIFNHKAKFQKKAVNDGYFWLCKVNLKLANGFYESLKKRNPFPCPRHKQKNSGAIMCRTSL